MEFVKLVYQTVATFPHEELYALADQLKRAAVSIPSNIAEGSGRASDIDFLHFLYISRGSLYEVDTQLELAEILGYCSYTHRLRAQEEKVGKLLNGLIRPLKAND